MFPDTPNTISIRLMIDNRMLSISIDIGKVETDDLAGMMQHVH